MSDRRLKWQCRRGMRELDVLLSGYLEKTYPASDDASKQAFRRLLELSDPELNALLLGGIKSADTDIAHAVALVRGETRP
ncbi:MAG: succinate dehydrogenase assembly factor 2 [Woeseiaceae bacterium]